MFESIEDKLKRKKELTAQRMKARNQHTGVMSAETVSNILWLIGIQISSYETLNWSDLDRKQIASWAYGKYLRENCGIKMKEFLISDRQMTLLTYGMKRN